MITNMLPILFILMFMAIILVLFEPSASWLATKIWGLQ